MKKKVLSQINALAKSIIASENDIDIIKTKHTLIQLYEKLTVLEFCIDLVELLLEGHRNLWICNPNFPQ